jgi:hypothetical protein
VCVRVFPCTSITISSQLSAANRFILDIRRNVQWPPPAAPTVTSCCDSHLLTARRWTGKWIRRWVCVCVCVRATLLSWGSVGARVEWIRFGRARQRRISFDALCKGYQWAFVVPVRYRTTFYKNVTNRPGFQIDLFFKIFLLDLLLKRALESARIVGGIRSV